MSQLLVKTDAGRTEVQSRSRKLPRAARTLLVLADGQRTRDNLLEFVQGATAADVDLLIGEGLLVATEPRGGSRAETAARAEAAAQPPAPLGYQDLAAALNLMCRDHLGLVRGFTFALEIEKASGLEELVRVAQRFVELVGQREGPDAARRVQRALALPG